MGNTATSSKKPEEVVADKADAGDNVAITYGDVTKYVLLQTGDKKNTIADAEASLNSLDAFKAKGVLRLAKTPDKDIEDKTKELTPEMKLIFYPSAMNLFRACGF